MMIFFIVEMFYRGRMLWIIFLSIIVLGWIILIFLIEDLEEIDEFCFDLCYCEVKESFFYIYCDSKGFINIS